MVVSGDVPDIVIYGDVGDEDTEFIIAISSDDAFGTDFLFQYLCRVLKDHVTDRMTICVIDLLEVVKINHEKGKHDVSFRYVLHVFDEVFLVDEVRQGIEHMFCLMG